MKYILLLTIILISTACINPQVKFRKSRLLDPMMDPAKTSGFHSSMSMEPLIWSEKGSTAVGSSVGASCPTCGG